MCVRTAIRLGRGSSSARSIAASMAVDVVAVLDPLGVPFVGIEPREHVLAPGHPGGPVQLDVVVVPEIRQLAESEMPGQRRGLGRDALLEVAVRDDPEDAMVDDGVAGPVELPGEAALGDRHPDAVGEALAERAGGRLDAGREAVFGVAGRARAPLPEALEVGHRDVVAGQVEQRVEQHAGVAGRQDEAIPVRPVRLLRGVAQEPRPDDIGHRAPCPSGRPDGPTSPSGRRRSRGSESS